MSKVFGGADKVRGRRDQKLSPDPVSSQNAPSCFLFPRAALFVLWTRQNSVSLWLLSTPSIKVEMSSIERLERVLDLATVASAANRCLVVVVTGSVHTVARSKYIFHSSWLSQVLCFEINHILQRRMMILCRKMTEHRRVRSR